MSFYDTPGLRYDSGAVYDAVTLPQSNRKIMAKVKFSLKDTSDADVIQTCTNLNSKLDGNANFPTPPVDLATFTTQIESAQTKLTASNNAQAASKQATTDKDVEMEELKSMAMQLVGYVDLKAAGDESKILSAGLSIRAGRAPAAVPSQVMNLSVTAGDNEGSLDVHWDSAGNVKSYEVQSSADPFTASSFVTRDTVTKSSTTLSDLTSGARTWVRVRGINSAGKGPWSDPAVKTVP